MSFPTWEIHGEYDPRIPPPSDPHSLYTALPSKKQNLQKSYLDKTKP